MGGDQLGFLLGKANLPPAAGVCEKVGQGPGGLRLRLRSQEALAPEDRAPETDLQWILEALRTGLVAGLPAGKRGSEGSWVTGEEQGREVRNGESRLPVLCELFIRQRHGALGVWVGSATGRGRWAPGSSSGGAGLGQGQGWRKEGLHRSGVFEGRGRGTAGRDEGARRGGAALPGGERHAGCEPLTLLYQLAARSSLHPSEGGSPSPPGGSLDLRSVSGTSLPLCFLRAPNSTVP